MPNLNCRSLYNLGGWLTQKHQVFLILCRERAPISSKLNAIDLYLVVCIFLVFGALMEYAAILLLLKKRRKPKYSIDAGLKKMFNNGDATQPLQGRRPGSGGPSTPTSAGALEEAKRMVRGHP